MSPKEVTVKIRLRDLERTKLLIYQLYELRRTMMLVASPFASDLDRIIDRYLGGGDDEVDAAR
jgi:hypothetical protein